MPKFCIKPDFFPYIYQEFMMRTKTPVKTKAKNEEMRPWFFESSQTDLLFWIMNIIV